MLRPKPICYDCGQESGTEVQLHTGKLRKMRKVFGRDICEPCYYARLHEKMASSRVARESIEAIVFCLWKRRLEGKKFLETKVNVSDRKR